MRLWSASAMTCDMSAPCLAMTFPDDDDTCVPRHNKGKDVALAVARGLCFMHSNGVTYRHAVGHVPASHTILCVHALSISGTRCISFHKITTARVRDSAKVRGAANAPFAWTAITARCCTYCSAKRGRSRS